LQEPAFQERALLREPALLSAPALQEPALLRELALLQEPALVRTQTRQQSQSERWTPQ